MTVTALDQKTALVVIDLQNGIVANATAHPVAAVIRNAALLAREFRQRSLPVVLVTVQGGAPGRSEQPRPAGERPTDWAQLVPEMQPEPSDHRVIKHTWGAFSNTDLDSYLRSAGVTQIVLAGVATSLGVESTARFAVELGYNITFATDAMTDMNADAHINSVKRIFPRIGETGTTQEVIALLADAVA